VWQEHDIRVASIDGVRVVAVPRHGHNALQPLLPLDAVARVVQKLRHLVADRRTHPHLLSDTRRSVATHTYTGASPNRRRFSFPVGLGDQRTSPTGKSMAATAAMIAGAPACSIMYARTPSCSLATG
jgi:hypothetical protein